MSQRNIRRIFKFDYLLLLPIMALAFYIAFIPHLNYPYPLHLDEWIHLAFSKALMQAGSTSFIDPFLGESTISFTYTFETGYHIFWGIFHQISGIPWIVIFRYFPSVMLMMTVLSAYVLGKRQGFGWEAALFTCLIPTTVGILGPAFLVPATMGLLFIPLAIFAVFNYRGIWAYIVLFIFTCALFCIHAATALALVIILIPYILLNLKGNLKHSLGIALALGIPCLVPFLWVSQALLSVVKSPFTPQLLPEYIDLPLIIKTYGYLPVLLCLLGTFLLAIKKGKENYGLILGLLALLLMLVSFFTFHYGVEIMYYRGLTWMMLVMGIVAGAGLMGVRKIKLPARLIPWLKMPLIRQNVGNFLCLVLIGLTLAFCIPIRQDTPYYHMIDAEDYEVFVWIKDNVNDDYERAILDPWKATAFTAITGREVYSRSHAVPKPTDMEAYEFLQEGCTDTAFLRENGISIIYTRWECRNPDLVEIKRNLYLFDEALTGD